MQPSCTEPTPLDTKGKVGGKEGQSGRKGGERSEKKREKGDFYKKIGFCKFLLGLYKRILGKKVYICNIRIRNR